MADSLACSREAKKQWLFVSTLAVFLGCIIEAMKQFICHKSGSFYACIIEAKKQLVFVTKLAVSLACIREAKKKWLFVTKYSNSLECSREAEKQRSDETITFLSQNDKSNFVANPSHGWAGKLIHLCKYPSLGKF